VSPDHERTFMVLFTTATSLLAAALAFRFYGIR